METYDHLKQTYQIGEGVTAEADRRQHIAVGLILSGVVGLGSVFAFRDSAPNWLKTGLYMSAIGCPLVGAYSIRRDQTLTRMGQQFDQASRQHLAADLNMAHETLMKGKESQGWIKAIEIVSNLPETMQVGALRRWNLLDLVTSPQDEIIDVTPQSILSEGLEMPAGLMNQMTLEQTISDRASEELAIDWFPKWGHRCGIVCGESRDGKTFMLVNVVLAGFIREYGDRGLVYICDVDYGSSHDDSPPNTWLDLEIDRHVFTEYNQCFKVLLAVSKLVEDRVQQSKQISKDNQKNKTKNPTPMYDPVLFIIDELPALMAAWTDGEQDEAIVAIANILRRGLKQNVSFKIGTQTLAVSRTKINKDILQQTELVLLWGSAQMPDNYLNIGLLPGKAAKIVEEVSLYPRRTNDRYVCVRFAEKKLQIAGIPIVAPVVIVSESARPAAETLEVERSEDDVYETLRVFWKANPGADIALIREFTKLTGRGMDGQQLEALKQYLEKE